MGNKTSISVGYVVHSVLTSDEKVGAMVSKVFPVAVDEAVLPYVVYRPVGFDQTVTKSSGFFDRVLVEVACCAADYGEAVELAEAVRDALDGTEATSGDVHMRDCRLTDMVHDYEDDAYVIMLTFTIKI